MADHRNQSRRWQGCVLPKNHLPPLSQAEKQQSDGLNTNSETIIRVENTEKKTQTTTHIFLQIRFLYNIEFIDKSKQAAELICTLMKLTVPC